MEKNGVFSRVRSRWRSIFSKKNNPVKLRDGNRISFERCIMSDPDEQVIGTIMAQATVEPVMMPNGGGITLMQETRTIFDEKLMFEEMSNLATCLHPPRRFYRLSSGDLSIIRRMTEEIEFQPQDIFYDGHEITGEPETENGSQVVKFKPGKDHPTEAQMVFLKQCLNKIDTRPPNMYYLTQGWSMSNFEGFFKYMMKANDCVRPSVLKVEFKSVIPSLDYLHGFVEEYAAMKGVALEADYVYAIIHSRKASREKKLRGALQQFLEYEKQVRKAKISYMSTMVLNSPANPNVTVVARFHCLKPCRKAKQRKNVVVSVQLEHFTGHTNLSSEELLKFDALKCQCEEDDEDDDEIQLSFNEEDIPLVADETDCVSSITSDFDDPREYLEMFPLILELFDKAGICEEVTLSDKSLSEDQSDTSSSSSEDSSEDD